MRHKMAEWIKKQGPTIHCLQDTHFSLRDTHKLRVKGWKKTFQANGNKQKNRLYYKVISTLRR